MGGESQGLNSKDTAIFWVGSVYGLALVGFGREPARLLQKIMTFEFLIEISRPMPPTRPLTPHAMHVAPISHYFLVGFASAPA